MNIRKYLPYLIILAIAIALPFSFQDDYFRHILVMVCIFSILVFSLDIIMGYVGQITLGHSAFFGLGAYTSAILSTKLGVSPWLGLLAAVALSAIFGLFVGYVSLRKARGVSLGIITFAFGLVLWLICTNWFQVTNGWGGLSKIPPPAIEIPGLIKFSFDSTLSYYYLALAGLILTIYIIKTLLRSKFGRAIISIRENEPLARSVGVNVLRTCVLAFALGTALAGFAGSLYAHYYRLITPNLLSMDYVFTMFIMLIVGGKATIPGPIIGAAIFILLPEWLHMADQYRPILLGIVFLLVILFMPNGLYPGAKSLWKRFISSRRAPKVGTISGSTGD